MDPVGSESPLYELRSTKHRGLALLAARDLAAGSRIIQEKPLFAVQYNAAVKSASTSAILAAFQDLARVYPDRAASYMRLHRRTSLVEDTDSGCIDLSGLPDEQKPAARYARSDDKSTSTANGLVKDITIILPRRRRDSGLTEDIDHTEHHHETFSQAADSQYKSPSALVSNSTSYGNYKAAAIINIFETNSLGIDIPLTGPNKDLGDTRHAAICLETSRLNHSCAPNLVCAFNASTGVHTVHAIRNIVAGEELCISYIRGAGMTRAQRREELAKYQFECMCAACTGNVEVSDNRRARLEVLREAADMARRELKEGLLTPQRAAQAVEVLREMITLMKAEGLIDLDFADLCGAAGLCCLRASRVGEALAWWEWKVEVLLCCLGADGPAYLKESKTLRDFKMQLQELGMQ